jgi:maleamate amidohydrolase
VAVWDDLLGDADRASFEKARMGGDMGMGDSPALVVVDMNYAFVDSRFPLGCSESGYPAVHATARLLESARGAGIPVFFTRGFDKDVNGGLGLWKGGGQKSELETRIVDELTPRDGEIVLQKRRPSAFFGTSLVDMLIYSRIDTVIVTGMSTSGCVRATVVDAFSYNYRVVIPEQCVADRSALSHKVGLLDMHMKYGDVVQLDDLADCLQSDTPRRRK